MTNSELVAIVTAVTAGIAAILKAKAETLKAKKSNADEDATHLRNIIDTQKVQLDDFKELIDSLEEIIEGYKTQINDLEQDIQSLEKQLKHKNITIENYKLREMELLDKIDQLTNYMKSEIDKQVSIHIEKHLARLNDRISKLENQ